MQNAHRKMPGVQAVLRCRVSVVVCLPVLCGGNNSKAHQRTERSRPRIESSYEGKRRGEQKNEAREKMIWIPVIGSPPPFDGILLLVSNGKEWGVAHYASGNFRNQRGEVYTKQVTHYCLVSLPLATGAAP